MGFLSAYNYLNFHVPVDEAHLEHSLFCYNRESGQKVDRIIICKKKNSYFSALITMALASIATFPSEYF